MRIALLHLRTSRPTLTWFQSMLDDLNSTTADAVRALGHEPVLIATAEQPVEATMDAVAASDAIVILGGEDVDPAFYSGPSDYPGSGHHEPGADEAQIAAVRYAVENEVPLLGICRGTQVINVALGGTLVQHLPQNGAHRIAGPGSLELVPVNPSLGDDLFGIPDVTVWCGHHQAIDRLGKGLVVAATAPDGVIEAVVHERAPLTGVQWHPEHAAADPAQLRALLSRLEADRSRRAPAAGTSEPASATPR